MGMYEEYKKLLKECIVDAKEILVEVFECDTGLIGYEAIVTLAIKLADVKVVAMELEE